MHARDQAVRGAAEAAAELARYGTATASSWGVLRAAIADSQDIRISLEDTTVLPGGALAAGNGSVAAAAARLVNES